MALIAHWPLNGDILDYSGNGFHLTNNSATISNEGKIGKCYEIQGRTKYFSIPLNFNKKLDVNNFSLSFWIKNINETNTEEIASIGLFGPLSGSRNFNLYAYNKSTSFHWSCGGLGNSTNNCLELNVWKFITMVIKNNNIKIYINNSLIHNTNGTNNLVVNNDIKFNIGTNDNNGTNLKYLINDFKIFNHELSKKEIKELYQTKILDWKFNECEEPTINLIKNGNFKNNLIGFTFSNGIQTEIKKENFNFLKMIRKANSSGFLGLRYSINKTYTEKTNISISLKYRIKKKLEQNVRIYLPEYKISDNSLISHRHYISILEETNNVWKTISTNFITEGSSKIDTLHIDWNTIPVIVDEYIEITDIQIEEKSYFTQYTPDERKGKVIDSSGYKNHGLIELNSSPKWLNTNEYEFDGINDYIKITSDNLKNLFNSNNFTVELKCKFYNLNKTDLIFNIGAAAVNSQLHIGKRENNKFTFAFYSNDLDSNQNIEINKWYHFVLKNENGKKSIFINGIKDKEVLQNNLTLTQNELYIGKRSSSDNYAKFNLSKIKIFATALSEQDIKELYENSMTIDKNNNINCNEIIENKNLINLKLFTLTDLRINGGTYKKNYNLNTYQVINPGTQATFRLNFNYDFIKQFENKEFIFSFRYKLISGTDINFTPSDINDGDFLFRKKIGNQFILKCVRPTYTDIYRFIDFILDANTEIEMYDFQMYLFEDYKTNEFVNKQGILYKEINEIDYIDTVKINKNNELICNTISEV